MADLSAIIIERYEALLTIRRPWETLWSDIAQYVMPRRAPNMTGSFQTQTPNTDTEARLFDTTAVQANMTLAAGQMSWMSPMEAAWFSFEPEGKNAQDEARLWLAAATDNAREELARSNFYKAIHEVYLDRGAFGTACLYIEPGKKQSLNCQVWPVGTFVIDEDEDGDVDTVIREFELTARQAAAKFGEDNISPKVRKQLGDNKSHQKSCYIHAIYPRADADRDKVKVDEENMPIASVYIDKTNKHHVKSAGYAEMPVMVSRYLEWGSGYGSLYGWAPSFAALPEARQLNFLQKMMDALAEKMAFPPVLAPDELEGEIDGNANGVTYYSQDLNGAMPTEWMTAGRYDIGLQRVEARQKAVNEAFHVDLFKMFAQIQKQMTATEVAERSNEKLIQFSPTFAQLTTELFNPFLERMFNVLQRLGKIEEAPPSLDAGYKITYSSRIALALRALPAIGYNRTLERLAGVSQIVPDVLDNYDFDAAERETAISDGVPQDFLREVSDRDEIRQARAEAQQAQQEAEMAAQAAESAAKLGNVPNDSAVGKVIGEELA